MTATTIITPFDPKALPKWAQRNPAVVARCATDLATPLHALTCRAIAEKSEQSS